VQIQIWSIVFVLNLGFIVWEVLISKKRYDINPSNIFEKEINLTRYGVNLPYILAHLGTIICIVGETDSAPQFIL
jgi:hypothetical protein